MLTDLSIGIGVKLWNISSLNRIFCYWHEDFLPLCFFLHIRSVKKTTKFFPLYLYRIELTHSLARGVTAAAGRPDRKPHEATHAPAAFQHLSSFILLPSGAWQSLAHNGSQLYLTAIEMQSKASERIHQHSAKPWRLALNLFSFCLGAVHRQYMRLIYLIGSSKWLGDETGQTLATYASDQHLARTILCICWMLNRQLPGNGKQDMYREKKLQWETKIRNWSV